jgi:hypothetical protein
MFVAKCAEYDRLLDATTQRVHANDRTDWMAGGVKSDDGDALARTIDEIVQQIRAFSQPPNLQKSYDAYTDARMRSCLPEEVVGLQQVTNLSILLPLFERSLAVPGDVAEFGCFRGGLSIKLAHLLKHLGVNKHVYAFDTFHGFEIDDPTKEFTKEPRMGVGNYVKSLDSYADLLRLSRALPITPIKGDATKLCAVLSKPLSFVWMDLDMDVLMDPVLRQIWHLCGPDTIIGVDGVGRPQTPTVRPWVDRLVASGAVEVIFNSDDVAPYLRMQFLKKKGPLPTDAVGAWRSVSESSNLGMPPSVRDISQGPPSKASDDSRLIPPPAPNPASGKQRSAKKILILGNSNSVMKTGYVYGMRRLLPEGSVIDNRSVGHSPGMQFAYYGRHDFTAYDVVIFDSIACDEACPGDTGDYEFIRSFYFELFSTIASQTRLIVMGFFKGDLHGPRSELYYLQADLADIVGYDFVDTGDIVRRLPPHVVPKGYSPMLDDAHYIDEVSQPVGAHVARLILDTPPRPRAAKSYAENFFGLPTDGHFKGQMIERATSWMSSTLAVMREGDSIEWSSPRSPVGFFVNHNQANAFGLLHGPLGTYAKSVMGPPTNDQYQLIFVPMRDRIKATSLECIGRPVSFETTQFFMFNACENTVFTPTMEVMGIAFWDGEHHDLAMPRRGTRILPDRCVRVPAGAEVYVTPADFPTRGGGWFCHAMLRTDGHWARWTGPETRCALSFDLDPGPYQFELHVLGAQNPRVLPALQLVHDERALSFRIESDDDAGFARCTADIMAAKRGRTDLTLVVSNTLNTFGLELAGLRIKSLASIPASPPSQPAALPSPSPSTGPATGAAAIIALDGQYRTPDSAAFQATVAKFVEQAAHLSSPLPNVADLELLRIAAHGGALETAGEQHAAVCAFLKGVQGAGQHMAASPEGFMLVARCAELGGRLGAARASDRAADAALAQLVNEAAEQIRTLVQPEPYERYRAYAEARVKSFLPAEVAALQQEANLIAVLPMFERSLAVPGDVAEFGCFRGVLSLKLAHLLKAVGADKHIYAYDTFHGFEIDDPTKGLKQDQWPRLGVGSYGDVQNAYDHLLKWSETLPLTPVKGDATKLCANLTKPLSFVWMDLDMDVLLDPVLRQIWPLCGPDTIIGIDDDYRPVTPTVGPWIDRLVASGAVEVVFDPLEIAPHFFMRFVRKKGPLPTDAVGAWRGAAKAAT